MAGYLQPIWIMFCEWKDTGKESFESATVTNDSFILFHSTFYVLDSVINTTLLLSSFSCAAIER
jgi:hypothetical protein